MRASGDKSDGVSRNAIESTPNYKPWWVDIGMAGITVGQ